MRPETVKRTWLPNMHHHIVDVDAALNVNVNVDDADDADDNDEQQQQQQACPPDFVNVLGKASLIMIDHNHRWVVVVLEWFFLFLVVLSTMKIFYIYMSISYIYQLCHGDSFFYFFWSQNTICSQIIVLISTIKYLYTINLTYTFFFMVLFIFSFFDHKNTKHTHYHLSYIYM